MPKSTRVFSFLLLAGIAGPLRTERFASAMPDPQTLGSPQPEKFLTDQSIGGPNAASTRRLVGFLCRRYIARNLADGSC